jgi:O-antigen ligase
MVLFTVVIICPSLWRETITGKYFWLAVVMGITVVSGTVTFFYTFPKPKLRNTDVWVFLFVIYIVLNFLLLNGRPVMHWWLFLLMIPLYVMVRFAAENKMIRRYLPDMILLAVLVEAVWGLLQLYGLLPAYHHLYSVTGSLFNPGPYSGFIAAGVPLALGHILDKNRRKWERWLGVMVLAGAALVLPAAMSRAAWIAALAGCMAVIWKYARYRFGKWRGLWQRKKVRITIVACCILVAGLLSGLYLMKKDSADGRRLIWRVSGSIIREHPVFGVGYGRFPAVYGDAQAGYFLSGERTEGEVMVADNPGYAFNEYVQTGVELGLAGLILFAGMVISCFRPVTQKGNGSCALLAFLVFAAFSYPFSVLPLSILFVFLLAIPASSSKEMPLTIPRWGQVAGIIVCLGITAYASFHVLSRKKAYEEWSSLQLYYHTGQYHDLVYDYRDLYPLLSHQKQFLFEYGRCLSAAGMYEEGNRMFGQYLHYGNDPMVHNCMGNNYKSMKEFEKAEAAYRYASQLIPNRHYPVFLLMKLYHETGQDEKAAATAGYLLDKPVKIHTKAIDEMKQEALKILEDHNNRMIP